MSLHRDAATDDELDELGRGAAPWLRRAVERRLGGAGMRRGIRGGGAPRGGGTGPTLAERVAAYMASVPGGVVKAGLAVPNAGQLAGGPLTVEGGKGSLLTDAFGNSLSQGTDGNRPVYNATGLGGGPCLTFAGGQWLASAATLSVSGLPWLAWVSVLAGSDGYPATACITGSTTRYAQLRVVSSSAWRMQGRSAAAVSSAEHNSGNVTVGAVRTGTYDVSLSAHECEVRQGGSVVTTSYPNDGNQAAIDALDTLVLGAQSDTGAGGFTGSLATAWLIGGTGTVAGALSAIALIEADLIAALATGDYIS